MEIQEIECHIQTVVDTLPVSSTRLTAITQAQADDPVCNTLISYCSAGCGQSNPSIQHKAIQEIPRRTFGA